ncbi:hypothetical protein AB4345_05300 [Vibrio breoganii]
MNQTLIHFSRTADALATASFDLLDELREHVPPTTYDVLASALYTLTDAVTPTNKLDLLAIADVYGQIMLVHDELELI